MTVANLYDEDDGLVDVPIDLSLEDWGRVALLANNRDCTISQMMEIILREAIAKAEEVVNAAREQDVSDDKGE